MLGVCDCRFRPIPHDVGSHGSSSESSDATKKPKKKAALIAGAPPQEMSGTVKMLFKEVAAIKREQQVRLYKLRDGLSFTLVHQLHCMWQTKEREAVERELLELSNTQKMLLATNSNASNKPKRAGVVENLDDWELAALRKRFHDLEEKKNRFVSLALESLVFRCGFAPFSSSPLFVTLTALRTNE